MPLSADSVTAPPGQKRRRCTLCQTSWMRAAGMPTTELRELGDGGQDGVRVKLEGRLPDADDPVVRLDDDEHPGARAAVCGHGVDRRDPAHAFPPSAHETAQAVEVSMRVR